MAGAFQLDAFQPAYQVTVGVGPTDAFQCDAFQADAFQALCQPPYVAPDTPRSVAGGWIPPKRRAVVVNGTPYIGTEDEIEALLLSLLDEEADVKPVKAKPKKKAKPVEVEIDEVEIPDRINLPLYKFLVRESFNNNDPWLTYILRRIMEERQDEDDIEVLLMGLH